MDKLQKKLNETWERVSINETARKSLSRAFHH